MCPVSVSFSLPVPTSHIWSPKSKEKALKKTKEVGQENMKLLTKGANGLYEQFFGQRKIISICISIHRPELLRLIYTHNEISQYHSSQDTDNVLYH